MQVARAGGAPCGWCGLHGAEGCRFEMARVCCDRSACGGVHAGPQFLTLRLARGGGPGAPCETPLCGRCAACFGACFECRMWTGLRRRQYAQMVTTPEQEPTIRYNPGGCWFQDNIEDACLAATVDMDWECR